MCLNSAVRRMCSSCIGDSGKVTVFVEVAPGFAISVQDSLTFPQAAPGTSVEAELDVTVWSNVEWQLLATSTSVHSKDGNPHVLKGTVDIIDAFGLWEPLTNKVRTIRMEEPPTSQDGRDLTVPIRFQPGFGDAPGTYTIEVQFTVVPAL